MRDTRSYRFAFTFRPFFGGRAAGRARAREAEQT